MYVIPFFSHFIIEDIQAETYVKFCIFAKHTLRALKFDIVSNVSNVSNVDGRVYLPGHGAHKARKVRWITRDGANNS